MKNKAIQISIVCLSIFFYKNLDAQINDGTKTREFAINRTANNEPLFTNYKIDVTKKYRLRNPSTEKHLEVEDGLFNKGVRVQQYRGYSRNGSVDGYNQEWIFIPAGTVIGSNSRSNVPVVRILNYGFLKYLRNTISSGKVIPELGLAFDHVGADGDDAMWEVIPQADRQTIKLRSIVDGLFLQFPSDTNDGTEMELAPESSNGRQLFLYTTFSGYVTRPTVANNNNPINITPVSNENLNLSVGICSPEENALLMLSTKNSVSQCQQFTLHYTGAQVRGHSLVQIAPAIQSSFSVKLQANNNLNGGNIVIGGTTTDPLSYWIMVDVIKCD